MSERLAEQLELLPDYLGRHVLLTLMALGLGVAISLPLAVLCSRSRSFAGPVLAVASVVQTIPGLALLALMVPLLGGRVGAMPALIALVLYSVLPILRNAVTGLREVDAALIEAGRGIGMTESQILWRVRFPLALPVIIAGVRTATVWVVGLATLSTPVGATSLGNYIFSGLQTQNHTAVLVGCVAAAALALALDGLIRLLELGAARRSLGLGALAGAGLLVVLGGGLLPLVREAIRADDRPVVRIGAKTFTEQYVLARLIANRLEQAGFRTESLESLGSTVVFNALASGEIDCYVDYTGTIWANHMHRDDNPGAEAVLGEVTEWLRAEHGISCLGPLGFENAYALAMRRDHAGSLGVKTIADLRRHAPSLSIGGDYEFFSRPEWYAVRDAYGLAFGEQRSFDSTLMYSAIRDEAVDVISAFSTDGRIAAFDLVVLEDPKESLPPYDAVLLLSRATAEDVADALQPLVEAIDDDAMRRANMLVDVDGGTIESAAATLRSP